jgi:hypothetical protein
VNIGIKTKEFGMIKKFINRLTKCECLEEMKKTPYGEIKMNNGMLSFIFNIMWSYEHSLRQTGRTTRLCNEAKKNGGVVVCHNQGMVKYIQDIYNIKAVNLDTYLNPDYHRGRVKHIKYYFDSPAEQELIKRKLCEVKEIMEGNVYVR